MDFIEELSAKRKRWIEANRENDFEEGIRNLLTELYPDNAHFVYELLQNAEDARATKVHFSLDTQGLKVTHNGKRQFTEADVQSITSIGRSTKSDDFNQIGKFGVGFKAVFSYTETPRVFSGNFAFEIRDLVCPKKIEHDKTVNKDSTVFWFPFNHPQKSIERAVEEIKSTLRSLPDITILFLRNIEEIHWDIEDGQSEDGFILRSKKTPENIYEIRRKSGTTQKTHWLKYEKAIPEKGGMFVAIAFRLRSEKQKKDKVGTQFKIDSSITRAEVSIFFPAEKESSNLRFSIHAPFAATIARDSIQNRPENENLRNLLVDLLIESLPKIKKAKLLNRNLLEVLPNRKDELSPFYAPFRERLIETFQKENLTPSWKNRFLPSERLYQASGDIKNVINNETILSALNEGEVADWVVGAQRGTRLHDFLESLEIKDWTYDDLLDKVETCLEDGDAANRILKNRDDGWMESLYVLLGKAIEESVYSWTHNLGNANLVRLQNGRHSLASGVYFESELVTGSSNVPLVKREVYSSHKDPKVNAKAVAFLESLGVKAFEPTDEIRIVLDKYYKKGGTDFLKQSDELNAKHIRKFMKFLKDFPEEREIFAEYFIFRVEGSDEKTYYATPEGTFVDAPFEITGLSAIQPFISLSKLWEGYNPAIKNHKEFLGFLKEVGVKFDLEVEQATVSGNPEEAKLKTHLLRGARESEHCVDVDYEIENLGEMLREPNLNISKLIWNLMSHEDEEVLQARYRPNSSYPEQTAPSKLVSILREYPWIPGEDGNFYIPSEMSKDLLPSAFPYDNRNGWLDAIGFGSTGGSAERTTYKERLAKQLRLGSVDELEMALEFARMSEDERAAFNEFRRNRKLQKENPLDEVTAHESHKDDAEPDITTGKVGGGNGLEVTLPTPNSASRGTETDHTREATADAIEEDAEETVDTVADDAEEERIRRQGLGDVETIQLVKARTGQGLFRANLEKVESNCRLTGLSDKRFLIASHIKPWRWSSNEEKLDGNNGLLLSPHVDKLFDKGWITFLDNGEIAVADEVIRALMGVWGLDFEISVGAFNEKQKGYLAFHRERKFKGILTSNAGRGHKNTTKP